MRGRLRGGDFAFFFCTGEIWGRGGTERRGVFIDWGISASKHGF
jgi:hypothetical protein